MNVRMLLLEIRVKEIMILAEIMLAQKQVKYFEVYDMWSFFVELVVSQFIILKPLKIYFTVVLEMILVMTMEWLYNHSLKELEIFK